MGFLELCLECLPVLIEGGSVLASNAGGNPGTNSRNSVQAIGRLSVTSFAHRIALYSTVYPETDQGILSQLTVLDIDDMIFQAKDGDAGPERQHLYELAIVQFTERSSGAMDPGDRLKSIREKFTPKGLQRHSKADGIFAKHSSYNERFILYLCLKKPDVVCSNFACVMDDADAGNIYSIAETKYRKYRGKKTLDQRKEDHRYNML